MLILIQAFVVDDDGKNHTLVGQHQVAIEALNKEATTQVIVRVGNSCVKKYLYSPYTTRMLQPIWINDTQNMQK